jgi:hypothetical protein
MFPRTDRTGISLIASVRQKYRQPIAYGIVAAASGAKHGILLEIFLPEIQERGMAYGTCKHAERCFDGHFRHLRPV